MVDGAITFPKEDGELQSTSSEARTVPSSLPLLERLSAPVPRRPLGTFPSPVEHHPELARALGLEELTLKRDDRNSGTLGGNKLRALEFLLPQLPASVVTMGGYGSTWAATLATFGRAGGLSVHLALFPQPWTQSVAASLAVSLTEGTVYPASSRVALLGAIARAWRGAARHGAVRWVAAGGAEPWGVLGSINAGLELARQIEQGVLKPPAGIVVPLGSGGTAAGLLLAAWIAGLDLAVCAVRVTDPWFANRLTVMGLVRRTRRLLRQLGLSVTPGAARLLVVKDQLGGGYGRSTAGSRDAVGLAATAGLHLEETYGAKAFAALESLAPSFARLCFWHTFDARLVAALPLDHPLLRQARLHAESLWPHPKLT
ncbi:MAG TPA: pyridoxal-phosphate dependent enzyme [Gemmatimonadales bacterium]|nr:pyridoxal-phosphate dependent enzyme [Gemmatimonadales bacterium]